MNANEKDLRIIKHIADYCDQIESTVARFGDDFSIFDSDQIYRNAVSLCILQIGELVGILSDEFKNSTTEIQWKQIRQMRNIVVHRYGAVDTTITWDVVKDDIPVLKTFCNNILQ